MCFHFNTIAICGVESKCMRRLLRSMKVVDVLNQFVLEYKYCDIHILCNHSSHIKRKVKG